MVCAKNPQQWCIAVCGGMDFYGDIILENSWCQALIGFVPVRLTKHHFLGKIQYGLYHHHLSAIIPKSPFFEAEGKLLED